MYFVYKITYETIELFWVIKYSKKTEIEVATNTTITKIRPTKIAYMYCLTKVLENSIW